MTLSIFPNLFTYSIFAITLIRIFSAFVFIKIAIRRKNKIFNWIFIPEILASLMLLVGLYMQIAVIALWILIMIERYLDKKNQEKDTHSETFLLLEVCLISLLFLGPGAFAFDLPL